LEDLLDHDKDCLLIMAQGLGLYEVLSSFVLIHAHKDTTVLVINAPKAVQQRLELDMRMQGCQVPARSINSEFTPEERSEVYRCVCLTWC